MTICDIKNQMYKICSFQKIWISGSNDKSILRAASSFSGTGNFKDNELATLSLGIWMSNKTDRSSLQALAQVINIKPYKLYRLKSIYKKDKIQYSNIIHGKSTIADTFAMLNKQKPTYVTHTIIKQRKSYTLTAQL